MRFKEVHLARAPAEWPLTLALDSFHRFLAELHFVKTVLPGASLLTDTGQEDDTAGQCVGICQLPLL